MIGEVLNNPSIWSKSIVVGRHTVSGETLTKAFDMVERGGDYGSNSFYTALVECKVHALAAGDVASKMRARAKRAGLLPAANASMPKA